MSNDDLLYHYFSNSLTKAQEEQLQELLKTDANFKKQFEFESNLKRAAKAERHDALKSTLNKFESHLDSGNTAKKYSFYYVKIAASFVILITAGWLGYQSFSGIDYQGMYDENYQTYPNTVYTITRGDTINSVQREAFVAYESGDYQVALDKFSEAEVKDYFTFYTAQSHLKLEQYDKAETAFKEVISQNKQFMAESHWYLALIYLKEENDPQALTNLEILVSNFDYKKTEARILIKKLK